MSNVVPVRERIFWVGANDYETALFEAIWPLPRGVSYNSYLILDEKVVLVDAVKEGFVTTLTDKIESLLAEGRGVDYLVVNHMEPDHSGAIKMLRGLYPQMQIVGNKKTAGFLERFYGLSDCVKVVEDGEELDLGQHKLRFHLTPMVHWPETMMTYETTEQVLFSGDAFGGFGALPDGIFDDEVDVPYFEDEILRYFSNIVGKYSTTTQKAIAKLKDVPVRVVASTHGPIWRSDPQEIIDRYARWSNHETEEGVVVCFASMYGNTERMAEAVARAVADAGVEKVRVHNVSRSHDSYMIRDIWRYRGLVLGSPTYNTRVFPMMGSLLEHLENKKMKGRFLGIFGTYGWSKGAVTRMQQLPENGQWELLEPTIEAHCSPTEEDLQACAELGNNIARAVKAGPA